MIKQNIKKAPVAGSRKKNPVPAKSKFPVEYILLLLVVLITFFTYRGSLDNPFLTVWDDQMHITDNKLVTASDGWHLREFFTPNRQHLYHPLTMLSFALEYRIAGLDPRVFHATNLFLHLCNIILVFWFVSLLTKRKEIALIVAFFFALHPMQVESVAWISERKDVLYGFFYLAALVAYIKFMERKRWLMYFLLLLLFSCSLLSKPAAVTLPVILLLTDFYKGRSFTLASLLEKAPLFVMSLVVGMIPFLYQKTTGDIKELASDYTLFDRLFLASYAVGFYMIKFIAPVKICAIYYLPGKVNGLLPLVYYLSPLFPLGLAMVVYKTFSRHREIFYGSLFFIITISLVLQIIPIARAITADRYTYIPCIGFALIAGHLYARYAARKTVKTVFLAIFCCYLVIFPFMILSRIPVWHDGLALFNDVVEKNPDQPHGWAARANVKMKMNDNLAAVEDFKKAIALDIREVEAYNNCGACLYNLNRSEEAVGYFDRAIEMNPAYAMAYYNRGRALERTGGRNQQVIADYTQAIRYDSSAFLAYISRGWFRVNGGDVDGAWSDALEAIKIDSTYPGGWQLRGMVNLSRKNYTEAIADYDKAISFNPELAEAFFNRAVARYYSNDMKGACEDWKSAKQYNFVQAEEMLRQFCK